MSLNNICYEQIKDNYWYGLFGDFKLIIDKNTGYFNATKLCASAGKRFRDWSDNKRAKFLLEYYRVNTDALNGASAFYEVRGDNKDEITSKITGTYVYKKLLLDIASWLSTDFYDKCYDIIEHYFIQDFKNLHTELRKRLTEAEQNINHLKRKNEEDNLEWYAECKQLKSERDESYYENSLLESENSSLHSENSFLEDRNEKLEPIAAPYTRDPRLHECFVIIRKNGGHLDAEYPYYAIRVQQRALNNTLKKLRTKYPNFDIIYGKKRDPNSIKLYRLMIEKLLVRPNNNHFNTHLPENELVRKVDSLYNMLLE